MRRTLRCSHGSTCGRPTSLASRSETHGSDCAAEPHGGDLAAAAAQFGRQDFLDLSTGINPTAYPVGVLSTECWSRLPGSDAALRRAAAAHYGVGDPRCVVSAAGSQALIQLLPRLFPTGQIAVIGPTYGELSRCWRDVGRSVAAVPGIDALPAQSRIVVLANPNNPDGRVIAADRVLALAETLARRDGMLIVDEAFADCEPPASVSPAAGAPGLLVLRSFGKFFGLAGLRLGFALAPPALAEALRRALGPWPVSGPALAIGEAALADHAWIARTRVELARQAAALDAALRQAGLEVIGGCALFRLVATDQAAALAEHLGRRGILVRAFAEHPGWLRFGLPGAACERLATALEAFVRG
jgi:cobalamin biosynthetic protein CobC